MNLSEVLISTGIVMILMIVSIVMVFILYTKKSIQNIQQQREFDSKIQRAIISSQESEREVLANNLHDDFGPLLSILSRQLKRDEHPGSSITFSSIERESIHDKLDRLIADIRRYSTEIYPTQIKHFGFISSLQQNLVDMSHQIETHFFDKMDRLPNFDQTQELTLYRVVNEVLNNILKHAKASELECELLTEKDYFQIQIMHNGLPFTQEMFLNQAHSKNRRGCSSILNRTLQLNGSVEFYRILDEHSCVRISIPMS